MAVLLRGAGRGDEVSIRQFCNDWFSVGLPDGRTKIGPGGKPDGRR